MPLTNDLSQFTSCRIGEEVCLVIQYDEAKLATTEHLSEHIFNLSRFQRTHANSERETQNSFPSQLKKKYRRYLR